MLSCVIITSALQMVLEAIVEGFGRGGGLDQYLISYTKNWSTNSLIVVCCCCYCCYVVVVPSLAQPRGSTQ